jgi:hypothetical protein
MEEVAREEEARMKEGAERKKRNQTSGNKRNDHAYEYKNKAPIKYYDKEAAGPNDLDSRPKAIKDTKGKELPNPLKDKKQFKIDPKNFNYDLYGAEAEAKAENKKSILGKIKDDSSSILKEAPSKLRKIFKKRREKATAARNEYTEMQPVGSSETHIAPTGPKKAGKLQKITGLFKRNNKTPQGTRAKIPTTQNEQNNPEEPYLIKDDMTKLGNPESNPEQQNPTLTDRARKTFRDLKNKIIPKKPNNTKDTNEVELQEISSSGTPQAPEADHSTAEGSMSREGSTVSAQKQTLRQKFTAFRDRINRFNKAFSDKPTSTYTDTPKARETENKTDKGSKETKGAIDEDLKNYPWLYGNGNKKIIKDYEILNAGQKAANEAQEKGLGEESIAAAKWIAMVQKKRELFVEKRVKKARKTGTDVTKARKDAIELAQKSELVRRETDRATLPLHQRSVKAKAEADWHLSNTETYTENLLGELSQTLGKASDEATESQEKSRKGLLETNDKLNTDLQALDRAKLEFDKVARGALNSHEVTDNKNPTLETVERNLINAHNKVVNTADALVISKKRYEESLKTKERSQEERDMRIVNNLTVGSETGNNVHDPLRVSKTPVVDRAQNTKTR